MQCRRCGIKMLDDEQVCSRCGFRPGVTFNDTPAEVDTPGIRSYYAGFWGRLAAVLLDFAFLGSFELLFGIVFGGMIMGISAVRSNMLDFHTIQSFTSGFGLVLGVFFSWLYFTLFESSSSQATLGKRAFGMMVTDLAGRRISFRQANKRFWGKIISTFFLMFGFFMAGWSEKKQGLHDVMAKTIVIHSGVERPIF
jgi:uncharacterized RDD family membrane protein YckC